MQNFSIEKYQIGDGNPSFLIAEIAQAHDGSIGYAHSFIDLAKDVGANAVKFQTHIADSESSFADKFRVNFSYEDKSRYEYWKRMEFTKKQWLELAKHASDIGLVFLSSPFSFEAVRILEETGISAWKIASGEIFNEILLDFLIDTQKPLLLSTGMSKDQEVDQLCKKLISKNVLFGLFQCISKYPTPLDEIFINKIDDFKNTYGVPSGLSDHSGTIFPALVCMARGGNILELHLKMHKSQFGPDTIVSLSPDEFKLISEARNVFHQILNSNKDKNNIISELEELKILFSRSICLVKNMRAGTTITKDMLTLKKPGTGLPVEMVENIVGKKLTQDVSSKKILSTKDFK